jgi:hypothetical protein
MASAILYLGIGGQQHMPAALTIGKSTLYKHSIFDTRLN